MEKEKEFSLFARRNKDTIYSVCYMFSQNEEEVADLFQEVLVNLWNGFDRFRHESGERTWVYRVALNTCVSQERKSKRRKAVELEMDVGWSATCGNMLRRDKLIKRAGSPSFSGFPLFGLLFVCRDVV